MQAIVTDVRVIYSEFCEPAFTTLPSLKMSVDVSLRLANTPLVTRTNNIVCKSALILELRRGQMSRLLSSIKIIMKR